MYAIIKHMAQEQIHQEIEWLQQQLEAKKKELIASGETREDRDIVKDVIKNIAQSPAIDISQSPQANPIDEDYEQKEEQHKEILGSLIQEALSKSLFGAIKEANKLRNPHLLDEFHDLLADKYYEKLVASGKIKRS